MTIDRVTWVGSLLPRLVDELADELHRSVVVNDPAIRALYTSRHFGDEDAVRIRAVLQHDAGAEASRFILDQGVARWSGTGMLEGCDEIGLRPRLCVPLRERAELLGLLIVIDADHSLTVEEIQRIEETSRAVAAELHQARASTAEDHRELEAAVRALIGPDERARDRALVGRLARAAGGFGETACVSLTVTDAGVGPAEAEQALREVLDSLARHHSGRCLYTVTSGEGVLVFALGRDRDELPALTRRLVEGVDRLLRRPSAAAAGIGDGVATLGACRASVEQARTAVRRAGVLDAEHAVVSWSALGPYGPLLAVADAGLDARAIPAPVVALLRHAKGARLVETLRAFLDEGGSIPRTADRLHLHRSSLYYRFDQIREVTGLDLDDGRHRLLLHTGLLLADLVGTDPPHPGVQYG